MRTDREAVVAYLRQQDQQDAVGEALKVLPESFDTDVHAGLLRDLGVDISDLRRYLREDKDVVTEEERVADVRREEVRVELDEAGDTKTWDTKDLWDIKDL